MGWRSRGTVTSSSDGAAVFSLFFSLAVGACRTGPPAMEDFLSQLWKRTRRLACQDPAKNSDRN